MALAGGQATAADEIPRGLVAGQSVDSGTVAPAPPHSAAARAPALAPEERERLYQRLLQKREAQAARETADPPAPGASDATLPGQTQLGRSRNGDAPATFRIFRNNKNTRAEGTKGSTLAEPAAANRNAQVFAAGNFDHAEFSTNHGVSYTPISLPAGFSDAPILCCDHDVVIDDASKVVFHSALYVNSALNNGAVRLFVRPNITSAVEACSYLIDPAGTADNILPDYPHIALTKNFLYLSINALPTSGTGFARMYRFNLAQMRACAPVSFTSFTQSFATFGQRVWVPAEGTNNLTVARWIQHDTASTIRIFNWGETQAAPTQVTRVVQASNFNNPDCRGGIGNFDFIERSTAFSIAGFRTRCTAAKGANQPDGIIACYWPSAPTGGITQGHVRSAVFGNPNFTVIAQPHIFNQNFCFGYPAVTSNILGDIGLTIAAGGKAGGGGTAAQGFVGIDDPVTPGVGFFQTVLPTATGVANSPDGRFGDYFTIHPYQNCDRVFGATNYAWDSSPVDAANDVNSRWVEFGREAYQACHAAGG